MMSMFKEEIVRNTLNSYGTTIRTRQCKEGMLCTGRWGRDIAHVWIRNQMYRITKKGTLIKVSPSGK